MQLTSSSFCHAAQISSSVRSLLLLLLLLLLNERLMLSAPRRNPVLSELPPQLGLDCALLLQLAPSCTTRAPQRTNEKHQQRTSVVQHIIIHLYPSQTNHATN